MWLLLAVDHRVRVAPGALAMSVAVDAIGVAAEVSAVLAERAAARLLRYAESARWVSTLSRCVP